MVDANSAYTLRHADHLADLDSFNLMMIEQTLAHDDLRRHAQLQDRLSTPICLDESITGLDRAEDMLALGSGRIVNIKAGRVGGFTPAKAVHDLCSTPRSAGMVRRNARERCRVAPTMSPWRRFPTSRFQATSALAPATGTGIS